MKKSDINKGIYWCLTPGCAHVFNYKKGSSMNPKMSCPFCSFDYCLDCMTGPHVGITCDENKINRPF